MARYPGLGYPGQGTVPVPSTHYPYPVPGTTTRVPIPGTTTPPSTTAPCHTPWYSPYHCQHGHADTKTVSGIQLSNIDDVDDEVVDVVDDDSVIISDIHISDAITFLPPWLSQF